jgi:Icc protein
MPAVRVLHFTDPHLYADEGDRLRGMATLPALRSALAHAREHHWNAQALLFTGDLVQDDPGGYVHFRELLAPLGKPVLCLPGNHDLLPRMQSELAEPPFHYGGWYDVGAWRIVLLDSVVPGAAGGRLAESELERLERSLATAGGRHALVCLHHHPVSMASRWLDEVGLANPAAFFATLDRHRHVRALLWGHVHQAFDGLRKGVRLLATPSTCTQFQPRADDFAVDDAPPAYRVLELRDNGTLSTDIVWLDGYASSAPDAISVA